MSKAINEFLKSLVAAYGLPHDSAEHNELFFNDLRGILKGFSSVDFDAAKRHILRTYNGYGRWPKPAEIVEACAHAMDSRNAAANRTTPVRNTDWTKESRQIANNLIATSKIGRQAAQQGWIVGLWDFCRKNHRLPNDREAHNIRKSSDKFDQAYASLNGGEGQLKALGEAILARRQQLTDYVLHGVVS